MGDRHTSLTTVCSTLLWIAGLASAAVYAFAGTRGLGIFALLLAGGGGVLTIRRFLVGLADDLIKRDQNAFMIGLDAQRIRSLE